MSASGPVAGTLRTLDRDRYLATLVLKEPQRHAVQALYAFAAEVAAIPLRVSEPPPGEIRLQWWRDALEGEGHGEVRQNPVAAALLDTVAEYGLAAGPLVRLIAARRFDLYQDPMPDLETFEGYAGETVSVLYQYAATILNGGTPPASGDAAGHLGVAHALIGHLRAFGFNAARGRIFLPITVFTAHDVAETDILSGKENPAILAALGEFRGRADDHLMAAEAALAGLPKNLRSVFAPIAILGQQLKRLQRQCDWRVPPPEQADWHKIAGLAWWSFVNG